MPHLRHPIACIVRPTCSRHHLAPRKGCRLAAPAPAARPGAADTYQYDLEVNDGRKRSITVHDPVSNPGMQVLLDALLPLAEPE